MPTWMVIEDEPDMYEVLLAMFEMWGIEGVAFVDGEEAIAWIEAVDAGHIHGELPDLVLSDIRLPGLSGPEVIKRLHTSPRLKGIAKIMITAYRLSPWEEEPIKAICDKLMYKPLPKFEELRRILEEILAEHQWRKEED
ncbi:MAG: hypothetical protein BroJett018_32620 [Chloroflexota bacterium]|nr:response regulator [Chloroflexota bacterium]GIK65468.1 MAG: hypothetical protein BroJett018_32620 [Chloroflexota bacterium]